MRVRRSTMDDVPAMLIAHRAPVQRTAAASYDVAVIAAWSSSSDPENAASTIARMQRNLASGDVVVFVAEENGSMLGFGELVPARS